MTQQKASPSGTHVEGDKGGEWSSCTHLAVYGLNFDVRLGKGLAALMDEVKGKTAMEFGAGLGLYSSFLAKTVPNVTDAVALEPMPMKLPTNDIDAPSLRQVAINVLDAPLSKLSALHLDKKFDLVFSIEVMEHVPRNLHDKAFDFLASKVGNIMVFGAARPKQGGTGHIACRPREEFKTELSKRGLRFLPRVTAALSEAAYPPNHDTNTMVFTSDPNHPDVPPATLVALKRPSDFQGQKCHDERAIFEAKMWPDSARFAAQVRSDPEACRKVLSENA